MKRNWEFWAWIVWLAAFGVLETLGLLRKGMTLTYWTEHNIPRWIIAGFLGWLAYHFLIARSANR